MFFSAALGDLTDTQRRTAFYQKMFIALCGVTLLTDPISKAKGERDFCTLTIKGDGFHCLTMDLISKLAKYLVDHGIDYKVTRIDLAWDNLDFSPNEMYKFMKEHEQDRKAFRSLGKRRTLKFYEQPFELDENGNKGTAGVTFGSRESDRLIRCYDRHGFTRLELEIHEERANLVFGEIVSQESENRMDTGMAHLLDFVDLDWEPWQRFIDGMIRAFCTLGKARELSAEKTKRWLGRQVSVSLSVIQDLEPGFTAKLLDYGRMRKGRERYNALLEHDDLAGWQGSDLYMEEI